MVKNSIKSAFYYFTALVALVTGPISDVTAQCAGQNPRIVNRSAPISSRITNFLEYLPTGYDPAGTTRYPVIINWSGLVQIDNDNFCQLLTEGIPQIINEGRFPETVSDGTNTYRYIVISPQVDNPYNTTGLNNAAEANAMITYLLNYYKVDPARIYMTGFSFGAYLIMDAATSSVATASKLAAIVPVANCFPSGQPDFSTRVSNIVNGGVDVWGLQCNPDPEPQCPVTYIQDWVNSINNANPGQATFTAPCAGFHGAWDVVYEPTFTNGSGDNIYNWMIQFASNFALPAVIKNYSARLNNGKVTVEWTTTSESNSDRFILERAAADMDFRPVNTITAAGNSSTEKKYSLSDDQPLKGANFYRLALVNRDSKKEYYEIKKISLPTRFSGMVNIPNPAKGFLSVYLDIPSRQVVTIGVYDLNGKLHKQLRKEFSPGISENRVDVSALAKGTYFVRVDGESVSTSKKVLIN